MRKILKLTDSQAVALWKELDDALASTDDRETILALDPIYQQLNKMLGYAPCTYTERLWLWEHFPQGFPVNDYPDNYIRDRIRETGWKPR